ncbi:MAG: hypothetical protein ACRDSF_17140 [Pseudonocardiaceae bacterium]
MRVVHNTTVRPGPPAAHRKLARATRSFAAPDRAGQRLIADG